MIPILLTFIGLSTASMSVMFLLTRPRKAEKQLQERVMAVLAGPAAAASPSEMIALADSARLADRFEQILGKWGWTAHLGQLLAAAGSKQSVGAFARLSTAVALGCGTLAHVLASMPGLTVAASVLGALMPYSGLLLKRSRRITAFNTALPDAIDLMARALRAGHSMSSTLELIGEQSPQPLGAEFLQVFQQQKCGIPFRDALLQLGGRVPSQDLQFLITAILVQKETGGDLTEILTRTTHVIRERVRIQAEVKVYTAQGRLTGWILGLLPIALLGIISLVTPATATCCSMIL